MKTKFLIAIVLVLFPGVIFAVNLAQVIPQEKLPDSPINKVWQLNFNDDFDGSVLDESKWNKLGNYLRRNETTPPGWWWQDNASLNNSGQLSLKTDLDSSIPAYRSGAIDTNGKFNAKFGYFSSKIKFNTPIGHWGGFWMLADTAEVDMVENFANNTIGQGTIFDRFVTKQVANKTSNVVVNDGNYHEIGINWQPTQYDYYVDGSNTFSYNGPGIAQTPGYLLLTDEVGTFAGSIANAVLPDFMNIEYVHGYEAVPRAPFSYSIGSPGIHPSYPDSGGELNDGKFASMDFRDPNWVGIVGQAPGIFDATITPASLQPVTSLVLHTLVSNGSGIKMMTKASVTCNNQTMIWNVPAATQDGLYQIVLSPLPANCTQPVLRVYNWWWTFLSEIVLMQPLTDTIPPQILITAPIASTTIIGSSVAVTANVTDNVGVKDVVFRLDGSKGVQIGPTLTSPPYSITFDSRQFSNGVHRITATAHDAVGNTNAVAVENITISNSSVSIDNSTLPNGKVGQFYDINMSISGGSFTESYTWGVSRGLPFGLILTNIQCFAAPCGRSARISGTPTVAGIFPIIVNVKDSLGNVVGLSSFDLIIGTSSPFVPVITSPLIAVGTIGLPFSYQIIGTKDPTSYDVLVDNIENGAFSGLSVNKITGIVSGTIVATPERVASGLGGDWSFQPFAFNKSGPSFGPHVFLRVNSNDPSVPRLSSPGTATGIIGQQFQYSLKASIQKRLARPGEVRFSIFAPNLQSGSFNVPGLSFDGQSIISGVPTTPGTYTQAVVMNNLNATSPGEDILTIIVKPSSTTAAAVLGQSIVESDPQVIVSTNNNLVSQLTTNLSPGSDDIQVEYLQQALNYLNYPISQSGPGSAGNETTYFGNLTRVALQKFQCDKLSICSGSPSTNGYGNLGPITRAEINDKLTPRP